MSRVGVVGLGHVGRRIAAAFATEGFDVVGYDVDPETVRELRASGLPFDESIDGPAADGATTTDATVTTDPATLHGCEYVLVAVPTPVDEDQEPDVDALVAAGRTVGEHLSEGATVVLESTIYPGGTREVLVPALETGSGWRAGEEFSVGYSPERISPGEAGRGVRDIAKVVAGMDEATRDDLVDLYGSVVDATIHPAPSMEVAEAAKCLENVQRDVNIALVNEFAMACERVEGLDPEAVLAAAGTKWNFHDYRPGLVDGHCIPVDPYYLVYRFEQEGYAPELMRTARVINDRVAGHVAGMVLDSLDRRRAPYERRGSSIRTDGGQYDRTGAGRGRDDHGGRDGHGGRDESVLLAGLTYKPGLDDFRAPTTRLTIDALRERGVTLVGYDPHAKPGTVETTFDVPAQERFDPSGFDALVVFTPHAELAALDLHRTAAAMADDPVLVDVAGAFDGRGARDAGFIYRGLT